MKPLRRHNKILVSVNTSQKDDYQLELAPGIKIWMRSNFGFDGKVTKPVLAKVYAVPDDITDLQRGDMVLAHYNAFARWMTEDYLFGDTGLNDEHGLRIFSVEISMLYLKVDINGDAYPMPGYTTVERIPEEIKTSLILPPSADRTHMTMFKVVNYGGVPPKVKGQEQEEVMDIASGDTVICYKHSDLLINYLWQDKARQAIRIRNTDINAVIKA